MSESSPGRAARARAAWRRVRVHVALAAILLLALALRVYRIGWDHGYLFHPDERQVVFVTANLTLDWPPDWGTLLSPESTWNPGFFSYGSLPLYLLRILSWAAALVLPAMKGLRSFYVLGRALSALADVGTVYLTYALGRRLYSRAVGLMAAALLACAVLHIQLSHYYAVDTLLTCAVMLVLFLCVRLAGQPTLRGVVLAGAAIGVACAIKISALVLACPLAVAYIGGLVTARAPATNSGLQRWRAVAPEALRGLIAAGWAAVLTFVVLEPYALIDLGGFLSDISTESMMARGTLDLPYTRQYAGTIPYIYQITQTVRWSLGGFLGVTGFAGVLYALGSWVRSARKRQGAQWLPEAVLLSWFAIYFGITGAFYAKFLRYMLPVTPLLCLWSARMLMAASRARRSIWRWTGRLLATVTLATTALYAVAFLHVYSDHPWEQATEWICSSVPAGSTLMIEHWEQPLPIVQGVGEHDCYENYHIIIFPAYDPDSPAKTAFLVSALKSADYVVIASNRLYGSITPLTERYPDTSLYYQRLFSEELGFELVYAAEVYPQLGGVRLLDAPIGAVGLASPALLQAQRGPYDLVLGFADESYTVYDHPLPLIFRRTADLSTEQLLALLTDSSP